MFKRNLPLVVLTVFAVFLVPLNGSGAQHSDDYSLFDPLVDVCELIHKYYVIETDDEQLISGAINGMLHELDPYSEYVPPSEVAEFQKRTSGAYEGIGISIAIENGQLTVISPFEDSPAYQAGVLPGDLILEVNGESTGSRRSRRHGAGYSEWPVEERLRRNRPSSRGARG